jgi:hypothetical protein
MYAGLGGVVVNVLLQPDDDHTRHRPDIDDRSPASLDHPPAERACAPENGVQVDVYDFALFGVGRLRGGGLTPNAGVVDEDVDRAETIGQSRDCVRIRDVDLLERDISAAKSRACFLDVGLAAVDDDNASASLKQRVHASGPDPAGASGNDSSSAVKS